MKLSKLYIFIFPLIVVTACFRKDKNKPPKYTVSGRIFLNCTNVAANKTYYFVFLRGTYSKQTPAIPFTTNGQGEFTHSSDEFSQGAAISADTNPYHSFGGAMVN